MPCLGRSLAVQAELVGSGIQKSRYRLKEPTVFVFNVFDIDASAYLEKSAMEAVSGQLGLPIVPPIGKSAVPESIDGILAIAEGKRTLNPKT